MATCSLCHNCRTLMVFAERDRLQGFVPGPLPESHDNGLRLLLLGRQRPSLAFRQDSAPEGDGHVPLIVEHLLQHGVDGVVRGACVQDEPSVRIQEMQTHCR